jgi:hypothetical protein
MLELKLFTLEEANRLLPELSTLIERLRDLQEAVAKKEIEIDALELVSDRESPMESPAVIKEVEGLNQLISDFNATVDRIHSHGCFLKDMEMGLIDFYTLQEGRVVYLCWRYGEDEVRFWHEVGAGYASRQSLGE